MKPILLDLFCGAGGAAMGYHRAGFDVVGVDINPQPHYPFEFIQADAIAFLASLLRGSAFGGLDVRPIEWDDFDAVHASPPCQAYTRKAANWGRKRNNWVEHSDLLGQTRALLDLGEGMPYVIENVPGAPINAGIMLCGTMFGLRISKHRLFETNWLLPALGPAGCNHSDVYNPWQGAGRTANELREAMGIDWLPMHGGASRKAGYTGDLNNAIPPAYTEWIGRQLIASIGVSPG